MRQISQLHGKLAVYTDHIDAVVDGMDLDKANRSGLRLNFFEHIGVSVDENDRLFMTQNKYIPFRGGHLIQMFEGLPFASRITVKDKDDVFAIRPLLDFAADDLGQMSGRDVVYGIAFIDDHGGVVREAGGEASA